MRPNTGSDQKKRSDRHPDEKLNLVMQQAPVVEESNDGQQSGTGQYAHDLLLGNTVAGKQWRQDKTKVNSYAVKEGDWVQVDFARSGLIYHAEAQREMANGTLKPNGGPRGG